MTPKILKNIITHKPLSYDLKLLLAVLFLVGIGIGMVYSASSALALRGFGSEYYFLKRQGIFAGFGMLALVFCGHIPLKIYRILIYPALFLCFTLLILIHIKGFGITAGGATRWLDLGIINFQPTEIARLALVIYLAYSLSKKQKLIKEFSVGFLPHLIMLSVFVVLLIIQPDFGSIIIFGAITWIMMFVGGVRLKHLFFFLVACMPIIYYFILNAEYRLKRLLSFLDPFLYPADAGYQIIHSLMAFGTGGITGAGIGNSYQKLFFLPEPHTDFIFSVIGEEAGLWGVMVVFMLYGIILWRGISIARNAKDSFGALTAVGITTALGLQICINMGVAVGLLPTKGLTLPFLSYGGTSLVINMASVGILINIAADQSSGKAGAVIEDYNSKGR